MLHCLLGTWDYGKLLKKCGPSGKAREAPGYRVVSFYGLGASLVDQLVKNPPAVWETWVQSLGWEDLEKGMAAHSSILAWEIPWTGEPGGLQSTGLQRVIH